MDAEFCSTIPLFRELSTKTVKVTDLDVPAGIEPRSQLTIPPDSVPPSLAYTKLTFVGKWSSSVTPVA